DGTTVSGAAITLASTGVGYLLNTSGTTTADGSYTTKLLLGSNDTGSAVISATATIGGKKVTKTVTVAVGPKVVVGSFQGRWAVRVQNAKGSTVSVRVAGKWVTFTPKTDNFLFSRPSVKGKSLAIGVWVDGTKRAAQTITVK
ncbi:MAG: hypothetical protein RIR89_640, partial [Actinomycetota bacterium]